MERVSSSLRAHKTVCQWNLRGSVLTHITLSTAQIKRLILERIAVDVADSPVQDSSIGARAQDEFGCFIGPVSVRLRDSQAVADADDVGGPVAATSFDLEGSGGGLGAVDIGDVNGLSAVVQDELRGYGVGRACEGYDSSCSDGGEVHACGC
jgi:hypothetical protein